METSDISGIGKVFVQSQTVGAKVNSQEENLQVVFTKVMSQMQTSVGDGFMADKHTMDTHINSVTSVKEADYEQYTGQRIRIREESGTKEVLCEEVAEKVEKFAEDVKEVLKDELGVSDEQICEAMEELGFNISDLLNPNQLAMLVAKLTGEENMSALLCNEEFMTIMQTVGELGESLLQDFGVSADELAELMNELQNILPSDADEQIELEGNFAQETSEQEQTIQQAEMIPQKLQQMKKKDDMTSDTQNPEDNSSSGDGLMLDEDSAKGELENLSYEQDMQENGENSADDNADSSKRDNNLSGQQTSEYFSTQVRTDITGSLNQNFAEGVTVQAGDNINGAASQVDVSNIIKQIVEFSKVTINNATTTMEMQLNPENLGKIYMALSSKDGIVSAHITTQNEAVKEALESQMVIFKQNMNQAGIKVDAVEVTVGSHEFERNLEQNAKREQDQAEEQEKATKHTRRINLNDLDTLSGVMSEEESLVVQMMADQGNSVNFTA